MDNLDFLDAGPPANGEAAHVETPAVEAPAEAPQESQPEPTAETPTETAQRERDERGRFKAKEQQDQGQAPEGYVPVAALQEIRKELQALKNPPPQQETVAPPDLFEDPEGFVRYQNLQLHAATLNTTLNISEEMTRQSAGAETVEQAMQWGAQAFAQNPAFYQQFLSQRNPYGFLVEHFKRATTFAQLGDDPNEIKAFLAWKAAQKAPPAQATPQPGVPSPSIASAPSAGGMQHIATGPGEAFNSFIK